MDIVFAVLFPLGIGLTIFGFLIKQKMRENNIWNSAIRRVSFSLGVPLILVTFLWMGMKMFGINLTVWAFLGFLFGFLGVSQIILYFVQEYWVNFGADNPNGKFPTFEYFRWEIDCSLRKAAKYTSLSCVILSLVFFIVFVCTV